MEAHAPLDANEHRKELLLCCLLTNSFGMVAYKAAQEATKKNGNTATATLTITKYRTRFWEPVANYLGLHPVNSFTEFRKDKKSQFFINSKGVIIGGYVAVGSDRTRVCLKNNFKDEDLLEAG